MRVYCGSRRGNQGLDSLRTRSDLVLSPVDITSRLKNSSSKRQVALSRWNSRRGEEAALTKQLTRAT